MKPYGVKGVRILLVGDGMFFSFLHLVVINNIASLQLKVWDT